MLVHLNIGSNCGDRCALLAQAVAMIESEFQPRSCICSRPVESEPWGYSSAGLYLNIGVDMELSRPVEPEDLLDRLQTIERRISPMPHRNPDGSYRDREIDIDIILIDDLTIDTPRLKVPHPLMLQRRFVLEPLRQLRGTYEPVQNNTKPLSPVSDK